MVELLASRFARLDRAIDNLSACRHVEFGSVALEHVSARARDGAGRDEQARAWNIALLDGLLDAYVAVASAFGLNVAQGSEALLQRAPSGNCGSRRAQGERGLQGVYGVASLCAVFAPQVKVRV